MNYKGYTAAIRYDEESEILYGEVVGLRDAIMFDGTSVQGIKKSFHAAVDDYLEFCRSRNESPDKPYSGHILLRVHPDLHRRIALEAQRAGKSQNEWLTQLVARELKGVPPRVASR